MIIASLLTRVGHYGRPGQLSGLLLLLLLLFSSQIGWAKMQTFPFYTAGRYQIAHGNIEAGSRYLQQALEQGPDVIPLRDTYYRLCNLLLSSGTDIAPMLDQARTAFPGDDAFQAIYLARQSQVSDPAISQPAAHTLSQIRIDDPIERQHFAVMMATIFHNIGSGSYQNGQYPQALRALRQALVFQTERASTLALLDQVQQKMQQSISTP